MLQEILAVIYPTLCACVYRWLYACLCVVYLRADSSTLPYIVVCDNQFLPLIAFQWNLAWLIEVQRDVMCYGPCRTWRHVHDLDNHPETSCKQAGTCLNGAVFHRTDERALCTTLPLNTCNVSSCTSFYFSLHDEMFYRWFLLGTISHSIQKFFCMCQNTFQLKSWISLTETMCLEHCLGLRLGTPVGKVIWEVICVKVVWEIHGLFFTSGRWLSFPSCWGEWESCSWPLTPYLSHPCSLQ